MSLSKLQTQFMVDFSYSNAYSIGPQTPALINRARTLVAKGLLNETAPLPGHTMSTFTLTEAGENYLTSIGKTPAKPANADLIKLPEDELSPAQHDMLVHAKRIEQFQVGTLVKDEIGLADDLVKRGYLVHGEARLLSYVYVFTNKAREYLGLPVQPETLQPQGERIGYKNRFIYVLESKSFETMTEADDRAEEGAEIVVYSERYGFVKSYGGFECVGVACGVRFWRCKTEAGLIAFQGKPFEIISKKAELSENERAILLDIQSGKPQPERGEDRVYDARVKALHHAGVLDTTSPDKFHYKLTDYGVFSLE